jgi:hypothetical protein
MFSHVRAVERDIVDAAQVGMTRPQPGQPTPIVTASIYVAIKILLPTRSLNAARGRRSN